MMYDIIVVGAGCAGLTAAIYARRAEKSVLVIEKDTFGGQITFSPKVENYPGFKEMSGNEFADLLIDQALSLGAEIEPCRVTSVTDENGVKTVFTEDGSSFTAKAVILATGARHRMLGIEGEGELVGHGISFCAVCDGAFYKDMEVAVVGGGNSALQEATYLSDICKKVTLVQNLDFFTGEQKLLEGLQKRDNVSFITGTVAEGFESRDGELTALRLQNNKGEHFTLTVDGVFVAIGLAPDNDAFKSLVPLNAYGYFDCDETCTTPVQGVFVAGDCRSKKVRQLTTAAGDGAIAAVAAIGYVNSY